MPHASSPSLASGCFLGLPAASWGFRPEPELRGRRRERFEVPEAKPLRVVGLAVLPPRSLLHPPVPRPILATKQYTKERLRKWRAR